MITKTAPIWRFEDAEAHFEELVELSSSEGAQAIEVDGTPGVVVISRIEYDQLRAI